MPTSTLRNLGVINMDKNFKMVQQLVDFWKVQKKSNLTAFWAEALNKYIKDLAENPKFIDQMYDHMADLVYTMDTAPSQAVIAFAHLANMGTMTSSLKRMYDWNDEAIKLIQQRQNVKPKQVRIKAFQEFLLFKNNMETNSHFNRIMGASVLAASAPTISTNASSTTLEPPTPTEISEEDNQCLAEAVDLTEMDTDMAKLLDLGTDPDNKQLFNNPADADDMIRNDCR